MSVRIGGHPKKMMYASALAALLLAVTACAAGSQESLHAAQGGTVSELLLGFWHGIIAPITLIGEVINRISPNTLPWQFKFYEVRNLGVLYDDYIKDRAKALYHYQQYMAINPKAPDAKKVESYILNLELEQKIR